MMAICKLPDMHNETPIIIFKGDIIEWEDCDDINDKYEYEYDDEKNDWATQDKKIHNVVFEKGYKFDEKTLIAQGYPLDKWLEDGICEKILGKESKEYTLPEDRINDIEERLDQYAYSDDKGRMIPALLGANLVFDMLDRETLTGINRGVLVTKDVPLIYRYNGGFFEPDGEIFFRGKIQKLLGQDVTPANKEKVIDWIRDCEDIRVGREIFDGFPEKIVLSNCTYDILKNEIEENNAYYFKTTYFPIDYDSAAECPRWQQFLSEVLYEKDIPVIQEVIGYCFWRPYDYQKAIMLLGGGANGKSVFLYVLSQMLGKHNITTMPLQHILKRFNTVELLNKHANICGDLSATEITNAGLFKMLFGGDVISGEIKNKQGLVKFINTAKGIFACNTIPECKDDSYAYKRRWIIVKFPNRFPEGDPDTDPQLKYKLEKEKSGIFNWAMEGLRRLLEKGQFSIHETLDEAIEFQRAYQDETNQFCLACIQPGDETYGKGDLHKKYTEYCIIMGFPFVKQAQFTQKMKIYGPKTLREGQTRELGKCFHDIKYTPFEGDTTEITKPQYGNLDVDYEVVEDYVEQAKKDEEGEK